MYRKKSRLYRTVAQVVNFGVTHPEFFEEESKAADILSRLQSNLTIMSDNATSHHSGTGAVRSSNDIRVAARETVQNQIAAIYQTARPLGLKDFWLPLSRSDEATLDAGESFYKRAAPIKDQLIAHGLPPDFLEKLQSAVEDLNNALLSVKDSRQTRIEAMAGFDKAMKAAKADLKLFDMVMANLLRNDPVASAGLAVIRRADNTGGRKRRKAATPPPTETKKSSDAPVVEPDAPVKP